MVTRRARLTRTGHVPLPSRHGTVVQRSAIPGAVLCSAPRWGFRADARYVWGASLQKADPWLLMSIAESELRLPMSISKIWCSADTRGSRIRMCLAGRGQLVHSGQMGDGESSLAIRGGSGQWLMG